MEFNVNVATRDALQVEREYLQSLEREAQLHRENLSALNAKPSQGLSQNYSLGLAQEFKLSSFDEVLTNGKAVERIGAKLIREVEKGGSEYSSFLTRHTVHTITALMEGRLSTRSLIGLGHIAGNAMKSLGSPATAEAGAKLLGALGPIGMAAFMGHAIGNAINAPIERAFKEHEQIEKEEYGVRSDIFKRQQKLKGKDETERGVELQMGLTYQKSMEASNLKLAKDQRFRDVFIASNPLLKVLQWGTGYNFDIFGNEKYEKNNLKEEYEQAKFSRNMEKLGFSPNDPVITSGSYQSWMSSPAVERMYSGDRNLQRAGVWLRDIFRSQESINREKEEYANKMGDKKRKEYEKIMEQTENNIKNTPRLSLERHHNQETLKAVEKAEAVKFSDWTKY